MNKDLAAEIYAPTTDGLGEIGTGYPVARNLVLTALHVVNPKDRDRDQPIEIRFSGGDWCACASKLVWQSDAELDVALLQCELPQSVSSEVFGFLSGGRPQDHSNWSGAGFAYAGGVDKNDQPRLVNVLGKVHSAPDKNPQFELGAEFPPDIKEGWQGISGSPVFVHGRIIGVIVVCPANFRAERLHATPVWKLLDDKAFRKAVGYDDQRERRRRFEAQITEILEDSEAAIEAVTQGLEPPVNLAGVPILTQAKECAKRLLDLDVPEVVKRCKSAHDELSRHKLADDAHVVSDLIQFVLPAIYDHGVIEAVRTRKYNVDAALLELPAGIRTVAEIIMAGVDRRKTRFRNDQERFPEGVYSLPLPPESGFDADGTVFREAWHQHIDNQFRLADAEKLREAWDDFMISRFAKLEPRARQRHSSEYVEDVADELDYRARTQGKTYYVMIDAPSDKEARGAVGHLIRELKMAYPAVVFLQLNDDRTLEREEKRAFRPLCDMLSKKHEES